MKKKLLWVGDAGVASGFARATHYTLETLRETWDVHVLAVNYMGDPHTYPYPLFPAFTGGDVMGMGRLAPLVRAIGIDCVVIQTDPWFVPPYLERLKNAAISVPVVGAIAVDGKNVQGEMLNGLASTVFWTKFAQDEARKGGHCMPSVVIPLGVDQSIYAPMDRRTARQTFEVRPEAKAHPTASSFIVGNVNRNQLRKRFDLMVQYFCDWLDESGIEDAFLMLHTAPTGDTEFNVAQLMEYRGRRDRLCLLQPNIGQGIPEPLLAQLYNVFDVYLTTSQGEGMGLTTMEAMASGVPCVAGDWSALGDWAEGAAWLVDCTTQAVTAGGANIVGGVPDRRGVIDALDALYRDKARRDELGAAGLARVSEPRFRWPNIGAAFRDELVAVMHAEGK